MLLCDKILNFLSALQIDNPIPKGVEVLNPYRNAESLELSRKFYSKYYSDEKERSLILGINPGRFGAGLTGIPFTDPIKLESFCQIQNNLKKKPELSADFIYAVISAYGSPDKFYSKFYFSSVSPLGFTMTGKNLNYYDIPELQSSIKPFIVHCLNKQVDFGLNRNTCFILGEGKNFAFVQKLNSELRIFKELVPLPHPRFVMQYKRKSLEQFIVKYLQALKQTS